MADNSYEIKNIYDWLDKQIDWFVGGSSAVLGRGNGRDLDIVVLVDDYENARTLPREYDFEQPGRGYYSFRANKLYRSRRGVDLIITDDRECYLSWHKAMQICKLLNLTRREDRLKVHQVLLERPEMAERPARRFMETFAFWKRA